MILDRPGAGGEDKNTDSLKNKKLSAIDFPPLTKSRVFGEASLLAAGFLCMAPADPVQREKELTEQAKKYFADNEIQKLYVKHRLHQDFPKDFPALDAKDRLKLFPKWEERSWRGELERLANEDQAELNVSRWYPGIPDDIGKLAIKRETFRQSAEQDTLSVEDNATLDAWIRLPKGTPKERKELRQKLIAWRKAEQGDMPGNDEILKLAEKVRNGETLSKADNNKLRAWREFPYSKDYRSPEWAIPAKVFANDEEAAKWFEEARTIRLKNLNGGTLTDAEVVKLGARSTYGDNPRACELYVRKRLSPTDKAYKPLSKEEAAELAAWDDFTDVRSASSEEGRKLTIEQILDPSTFPKDKVTSLEALKNHEIRNRR